MKVKHLPYRSVESADSEYPWYEVEVDEANGTVRVTDEKDGGLTVGLNTAETNTPDHVDLPTQASQPTGNLINYAVTTDGEFIAYDPEEVDPDIRIKLGVYFVEDGVHYHGMERLEVEADTMLLLDFIE